MSFDLINLFVALSLFFVIVLSLVSANKNYAN